MEAKLQFVSSEDVKQEIAVRFEHEAVYCKCGNCKGNFEVRWPGLGAPDEAILLVICSGLLEHATSHIGHVVGFRCLE